MNKSAALSGILGSNQMAYAIGYMVTYVFGYNIWSGFKPFGDSSTVLDLEDFIVSNLFLPIGSLSYLMFCVSRLGWGFDNYLAEANTGTGPKISKKLRIYLTYILPLIVIFLFVQGLVVFFK